MWMPPVSWMRPAGPDGWAVSGGSLVLRTGEYYQPLDEGAGVHRAFLGVEGMDGAGPFVREYGLLTHMATRRGLPASESFERDWAPRLHWLRHVLRVWRAGVSALRGVPSEIDVLARCEGGVGHVVDESGAWAPMLDGGEDSAGLAALSAMEWARRSMAAALSACGVIRLQAGADAGKGGGWGLELWTLWSVIVWQAGRDMAGEATFRPCAACGKWLEESASMDADPSRTACSPSCRQKLYRQRKKAA